jgi:hypothetical protein
MPGRRSPSPSPATRTGDARPGSRSTTSHCPWQADLPRETTNAALAASESCGFPLEIAENLLVSTPIDIAFGLRIPREMPKSYRTSLACRENDCRYGRFPRDRNTTYRPVPQADHLADSGGRAGSRHGTIHCGLHVEMNFLGSCRIRAMPFVELVRSAQCVGAAITENNDETDDDHAAHS